jgi:hypothetical protein
MPGHVPTHDPFGPASPARWLSFASLPRYVTVVRLSQVF